jgi:hypothetical protein
MFQVKEAIHDDDIISPNFENIGDEVDVGATLMDETDQDEQNLPGQWRWRCDILF